MSNIFPPILTFFAIFALWQAICVVLAIPSYIFPSPIDVVGEIVNEYELISKNVMITLGIAIISLILGLTISISIAAVMAYWPSTGTAFSSLLVALQAIPVVALAPYFLIWFGPGYEGRILMAFLIVFVPATFILWNGFRQIDKDVGALLEAYAIPRWQSFYKFRLYLAVPFIITAIEVTSALAVIGAIVAELAGSENGVGSVILRASYSMRTELVFAVIVSAALASVCLFFIVRTTSRQLKVKYSVSGYDK